MAGRFKIEHIATLRSGEKVRSIRRGGHIVRIAFPKGRREKGSGRVLEVLHPARESNPCRLPNPAELVVMMANPSYLPHERPLPGASRSVEEASDAYQEFHGERSQHIDEITEPSPRAVTLSEIGQLIELRVIRPVGWKWGSIDFAARGVRVAQNIEGTQLFFVEGDQKISRGELTNLGADNSKQLVDLGYAAYIAYRTRKSQVNGIMATYEHNFGEETGVRPRLMYDARKPKPRIYLAGGEYRVTAAGIEN